MGGGKGGEDIRGGAPEGGVPKAGASTTARECKRAHSGSQLQKHHQNSTEREEKERNLEEGGPEGGRPWERVVLGSASPSPPSPLP